MLLFKELVKENPNLKKIESLVNNGEDINAINSYGECIIAHTILNQNAINNEKLIFLVDALIKLGADINYESEGSNCLFDACLTRNIKLIELLLKQGANPNCISDDLDSLLDWAEFEEWVTDREIISNEQIGDSKANMHEIITLLKRYGAKSIEELKV